jgi:hypothetical protein
METIMNRALFDTLESRTLFSASPSGDLAPTTPPQPIQQDLFRHLNQGTTDSDGISTGGGRNQLSAAVKRVLDPIA